MLGVNIGLEVDTDFAFSGCIQFISLNKMTNNKRRRTGGVGFEAAHQVSKSSVHVNLPGSLIDKGLKASS